MIHTDGKQTIANAPQHEAIREGSLDGSDSVPKPRDARYAGVFDEHNGRAADRTLYVGVVCVPS